jgi:hypothetical protein
MSGVDTETWLQKSEAQRRIGLQGIFGIDQKPTFSSVDESIRCGNMNKNQ